MTEKRRTDIPLALKRVMAAIETIANVNRWATVSGVPRQTLKDAVEGSNVTAETLERLAGAANMTVAEMLEFGDPDWEWLVAARDLLKGMSSEEIQALAKLLRPRIGPPESDAS